MLKLSFIGACTIATALAASCSSAATQIYDFEGSTEGFNPNGGLFTVVNDTIGATTGSGSLRVDVPEGAFFVGALTTTFPPELGDPPGVTFVLFDLTLQESFTGAFANLGITIFGASQPGPGQQFGIQAQFADEFAVDGLAPGTYPVAIQLDSATNPIDFTPDQSFNEIVGTSGSGPTDLIVTGFQIFASKSPDAPLTFFVDNVRLVVPEPASTAVLAMAFPAVMAMRRRRA